MKYLYLFSLIVIAPLTAELMNGSTPLFKFLGNPLLVSLFIFLPYSCLLIILGYTQSKIPRTGILFLLPIAGLVIEGLGTRSFFNTSFDQLSTLAGVGVWGGVQWPWTISLIASHAVTSFLVPLMLADFLVKENKEIKKWVAITATIVLGLIIMLSSLVSKDMVLKFLPQILITFLLVVLLFYFSKRYKIRQSENEPLTSRWFFVFGFLFAPINWFTAFFLAKYLGAYAVLPQLIFVAAYIYFVWSQWLNISTEDSRRFSFVIGYFIPHALVMMLVGFTNPQSLIVGLTSLILVSWLYKCNKKISVVR
jgi:hypothetical protein